MPKSDTGAECSLVISQLEKKIELPNGVTVDLASDCVEGLLNGLNGELGNEKFVAKKEQEAALKKRRGRASATV